MALDCDYQRDGIQQEQQQKEQKNDEIDDSDENHDDHDDDDDEWWKAFEPPPELSLDLTKDRPESSAGVSHIVRDLLEEMMRGVRRPAAAAERVEDDGREAADERNLPSTVFSTSTLDAAEMEDVRNHDVSQTGNTRISGSIFESPPTLEERRIEQRPTYASTAETKASQRSLRWGFGKSKGTADKGSVTAIVKMPKPVDGVLRKLFPKE